MKKLIILTMVLAAMQSRIFAMAAPKESKPVETKASTATKNIKPKVPQVKLQAPSGDRYEATVPDTLDLAHRAELALRGIAGLTDSNNGYQQWHIINWASNPPNLIHHYCEMDCTTKQWDAMAQLRAVCGSKEFMDIEEGMGKTIMSFLDKDDGLYYAKYDPKCPWVYDNVYTNFPDTPLEKQDLALAPASGLVLYSMIVRNDLGVTKCEKQIRAMVRGLDDLAIKKDDYAYFPDGGPGVIPCSRPRSGWKDTTERLPGDVSGVEEGVLFEKLRAIRGLSMWAERTGDEQALELAGKMVRYVMKPQHWGNAADPPHVVGAEQGHCDRHFAAFTHILRCVFEYGLVTGDSRIYDFVRSNYEYIRSHGISRIGQVSYRANLPFMDEAPCFLDDLISIPIKMSRAGIGDYWDDVDRIIRNHLVESQLIRRDLMERVVQNKPKEKIRKGRPGEICTDNVLDRMLGNFAGSLMPTYLVPRLFIGCCIGNGGRGLAHAWEGILEGQGDQVQVNLLLNRASKWADVDSYLPYEGKVVIRNKTAKHVSVRIPAWVDRSKLKAGVNGTDRSLSWVGAYVVFDGMKPGDKLQLDFPIKEETVKLTAQTKVGEFTTYTITFRGNTVVDISPRNESPGVYPIYLRDHMKTAKKAPMKTKIRFAPDKTFRW